LTVLKAALAGVTLEAFSATSKATIAVSKEEWCFERRFCCLAVEDMGSKERRKRRGGKVVREEEPSADHRNGRGRK